MLLTVQRRCSAALPRLRWLREESFWSIAPVGQVDVIRASVSALQDRRSQAEELARRAGVDLGAFSSQEAEAAVPPLLTLTNPFSAAQSGYAWLLIRSQADTSATVNLTQLLTEPRTTRSRLAHVAGWLLIGVPVLLWLIAIRPLFYLRAALLLGAIALLMTVEGFGRTGVMLVGATAGLAVLLGLVEAVAWWRAHRRTNSVEPIVLE